MTAGKLVALTVLGLMFTAGIASADLVPPLPPPPQIPSFPALPPVPTPSVPLETQQCVAVLNGLTLQGSGDLATARVEAVDAFTHQSSESQALVAEMSDALGFDQTAGKLADSYAAGVWAVNFTFQNTTTAFSAVSGSAGSAAAGMIGGASDAINHSSTGGNDTFNVAYEWVNVTEHRDQPTAYPFVNDTYNRAFAGKVTDVMTGTVDWVLFLNAGPPIPASSLAIGPLEDDAGHILTAGYGMPTAANEAANILTYNAFQWGHQALGLSLGTDPSVPSWLGDIPQAHAGSMTALAQSDAAALQGTLSGSAGYAQAWTLALPGAAPGCAHVSL